MERVAGAALEPLRRGAAAAGGGRRRWAGAVAPEPLQAALGVGGHRRDRGAAEPVERAAPPRPGPELPGPDPEVLTRHSAESSSRRGLAGPALAAGHILERQAASAAAGGGDRGGAEGCRARLRRGDRRSRQSSASVREEALGLAGHAPERNAGLAGARCLPPSPPPEPKGGAPQRCTRGGARCVYLPCFYDP